MIAPRFTLDRLLDAAGADSLLQLARITRSHPSTIQRWADDGVPWLATDHLAVSAGLHPATVWPEWGAYALWQAIHDPVCDTPSRSRYNAGRCSCPGCMERARDYFSVYRALRSRRGSEAVA